MNVSHRALVIGGCLGVAFEARAHSPFGASGPEWMVSVSGGLLLGIFWLAYIWGAWRSEVPALRRWSFHFACLLCALAVFGPLDLMAETSAAAHMMQHMLFIVVIAPLWVLGRPLPLWVAVGGKAVLVLWRPMFAVAQHPMLSAYLHAAVIWLWHTPVLYDLALMNPWWHAVEHLCFLLSAMLFWWSLLHSSRTAVPVALVALLFTVVHTGILGAILTFANHPFYQQGNSLEDQQLAGLIMWVLGGLPYLFASATIGHLWLRRVG